MRPCRCHARCANTRDLNDRLHVALWVSRSQAMAEEKGYTMIARKRGAAIYVRVSTDKQTVENQVRELRQIAERRGWEATKGRIPTEPVEQIEQDRGGKSLKIWPSPFRLPHPGGFGSRGIRTVPSLSRMSTANTQFARWTYDDSPSGCSGKNRTGILTNIFPHCRVRWVTTRGTSFLRQMVACTTQTIPRSACTSRRVGSWCGSTRAPAPVIST
jgi:hypothetical protein